MSDKKNLLLLPGWGFDNNIWQPIISYIPQNYNLITLDYTPPPTNTTIIGWSLGGLKGLQLTDKYPDKISKLIMVASSPKFIASDNWPGISKNSFAKFSNNYKVHGNSKLFWQYYYQKIVQLPAGLPSQYLPQCIEQEKLTLELNLLQNLDLREQLKILKIPVIFILAKQDKLLPIALKDYFVNGSGSSNGSGKNQVKVIDAPHAGFLYDGRGFVECCGL